MTDQTYINHNAGRTCKDSPTEAKPQPNALVATSAQGDGDGIAAERPWCNLRRTVARTASPRQRDFKINLEFFVPL